jgi:hypothetical protein
MVILCIQSWGFTVGKDLFVEHGGESVRPTSFIFKFEFGMVIFIFAGHFGSLVYCAIASKRLTTFQGSRHESKEHANRHEVWPIKWLDMP